jgi:hypothetical protein
VAWIYQGSPILPAEDILPAHGGSVAVTQATRRLCEGIAAFQSYITNEFLIRPFRHCEGIAVGKVKGRGKRMWVGSPALCIREASGYGWCEKTVHNDNTLGSKVHGSFRSCLYSQYAPALIDDLG